MLVFEPENLRVYVSSRLDRRFSGDTEPLLVIIFASRGGRKVAQLLLENPVTVILKGCILYL